MLGDTNCWRGLWRRPMSRRQILRLASRTGIGLVGLSIVGCAAAPAPSTPSKAPTAPSPATQATPQPVYGGTIVHAISSNMTLDSAFNVGGGYDQIALYHLYNTLLHVTPKITLEPEMALSWEIPDKTTFIYKLRRGVKFHDGADFNAQAVKANFDRILDPDFKPTGPTEVRPNVKAVEVVDDATIKFTLKGPNSEFPGSALASTYGGIVSPLAPARYNNDLRRHGVGTGPFQSAEWVLDDHITVKKFPGYWDAGLPYLNQITWKIIPDPTVRRTLLLTGEAQFIMEMGQQDIEALKADTNVKVVTQPGIKRNVVHFNMRKEPFSKKAARQALAYAVDRESISQAVYGGTWKAAEGLFPPISPFHDPTIKNYPFDLKKAQEKLAEAGYPSGFEFLAMVASARPDEPQAAEIMKSQLAKVGVKMNIVVYDVPTYLQVWKTDVDKVDAIVTTAGHAMEPIRLIQNYYTKDGGYANIKVDFPELEALVAKAKETYDLEEQRRYLNQADKLITENVWAEWAYVYDATFFAYRKNVMNYVHGPHPYQARFRKVWLSK